MAAGVPVAELRPCVLCPDLWPAAALDPRTRLCPACKLEIQERQAAEADEVLGELEALYGERADDTEQSDVGTQGSGRERDHPRGRSSAPAPQ